MRGPATVLFTALFLVLALYATLGMAETLAYDRATPNQLISHLESGGRAVFTGTMAVGDRPLVVRASKRRDFFTSLSKAALSDGEATSFDLDTGAGTVTFDWSDARISGAARTERTDRGEYSGFAAGDAVTVFAKVREDRILAATYISRMSPDDLVRDRFASNVNVLIAGVLFLGGVFILPVLTRRYGRRSRISAGFFSTRRRDPVPNSGAEDCSECQNSALLGLENCAKCDRLVELGPQAAVIERALSEITSRRAGSIVVRASGGRSLRLLWAQSLTIEFRPGELTEKYTVRVRQEFSRHGIECRRDPGTIWRIDLGDAPRRAAQIIHELLVNSFHAASDYRVEVASYP